MHPHELPVYKEKERILAALAENQVVVVESPTGSGKTTQIPLILHEAGYSKRAVIGVTQPRRIAALSVCDYIARQIGTTVSGTVGYKIRFEDKTTQETRIKIMTDGILLQELKADWSLSAYSVIMVDEAHERSLNIDFILGLLKRIVESRPDFKVVISSATINAEVFSEYFNGCPIVHIDTVTYPVTMIYDPPPADAGPEGLIFKITDIVGRAVRERRSGDILVFLTGEQMIKDTVLSLYSAPFRSKLHILPLYARLAREEQERVFDPTPRGKIKVICATNIAETSVTIDGISTVIDSGLAKMNYYNPKTFTSSLIEGPVSKASCNQRRGRAGRTRPGICYRLYTKADYETRPLYTTEEIYRTDLSEVVLRMAELGITEFESFDFISPPGTQGIIGAIETLNLLEALTPERRLSSIGELMARFPLLPRHSRIIVEAIERYPGSLEEVLTATAFLTANSPFLLPAGEELEARKAHHRFRDPAGDFVSYLKLFDAYSASRSKENFCARNYLEARTMAEIANIREQLGEIVSEIGVPISGGGPVEDYLCCISRGLIQFVCIRTGRGIYRSMTAEKIQIHPGSSMYHEDPKFIVAGEIVRTSRMYARSVSPLSKELIRRISPELEDNLLKPEKAAADGRDGRRRGDAETAGVREKLKQEATKRIYIGRELFELKIVKGKRKVVELPWERIAPVVKTVDQASFPNFKNVRGKVIYREREFLSGVKLNLILKILPLIDPEHGVCNLAGTRTRFSSGEPAALAPELERVLKLCELGKKRSQFGFVTLETDGNGQYRFTCSRSFPNAAAVSLASLETLVDELDDETPDEVRERVNGAYRRLTALLEIEAPPVV